MADIISALIPMLVVGAIFVAIAVTAIRATDGANRREGRAEGRPPARERDGGPGQTPRAGEDEGAG